ncbi:MAG: MFS transporter [Myxococcales bacterium]|nr:MFS transporter [Myxococcales bacterium]
MGTRRDGLSVGTKLAFGVGQSAEGMKNIAFSMFLMLYYNQVLGLDPGLAGLAVGISLAFDAVTDPVAGAISDVTRSRWGRRHPFMVLSAVPLGVTFFGLFSPPQGLEGWALFGWLLVAAILVRAAMTFYFVPHMALGAELSPDYVERARLFTYSTFFGFLGAMSMRVAAPPLFFSRSDRELLDPDAYGPFALSVGAAMVVVILLCAWGTRRHIPHLPAPTAGRRFSLRDTFSGLIGLMRFRSFRALFFGMLLTTFTLGVEAFMFTYMGIYFWGLSSAQLGLMGVPVLVGLLPSFYLVPWLTHRFDKRNAMVGCVLVLVAATNVPIICRLAGVFPENGSPMLVPLLLAFRLCGGLIGPALISIPQSMFADIGDEVALADGKRVEGLIFSCRSLITKATSGLGTMLGGLLLKLIDFPDKAEPGQVAPEVLFSLGLAEGPLTAVVTLVGVTIYLAYPLTRARHDEIRAQLAHQPVSL